MTLKVEEARRNGTGVPMPIKTVTVKLDDFGYPGWYAEMRINPRSSVYDDLLSDQEETCWKAFGVIVLAWNFTTEDGAPYPLPKNVDSLKILDLPVGIFGYLLDRYFNAFNAAVAPPKESVSSSATTSSTSDDRREPG